MKSAHSVVVIGAGVGGLAAALRLAAAGFDVTVVESDDAPGGKMAAIGLAGRSVDAGPTVFTMKPVFEELFADAGLDFAAYVATKRAEILARHFWPDGSRLDLHADTERSAAAVGAFAGSGGAAEYRAFAARSRAVFELLDRPFIRAERPANPLALVMRGGFASLPGFLGLDAFSTMADTLARQFTDKRLVQLFSRYATYCGSSPFAAPSTLLLIAHVEQAGVWLVEGGMHALAEGLARAAVDCGADLRCSAAVEEIEIGAGGVEAVRLASGERIATRHVVCNADAASLAAGYLGRKAAVAGTAAGERSLSAVTMAFVAPSDGPALTRHNVFFSSDYPAEFQAMAAGRLPAEPTAYLCAQDRGAQDRGADDGALPGGPERFLLVLNAPANGDRAAYDEAEIDKWLEKLFDRIAAAGARIGWREAARKVTTPAGYESRFPGTGGALYGQASHGPMASFRRPRAETQVPGLYLTGGSTHPGAGVPMAALSGRLAAERIKADLSSTG